MLPVASPPIADGWVTVDRGRVVAVGHSRPADGADERHLGNVALMPGLVNAHTHLELSYLHDEVPPASEFVTWIRNVMAARRERPDPHATDIVDAIDREIVESGASGTAVV